MSLVASPSQIFSRVVRAIRDEYTYTYLSSYTLFKRKEPLRIPATSGLPEGFELIKLRFMDPAVYPLSCTIRFS